MYFTVRASTILFTLGCSNDKYSPYYYLWAVEKTKHVLPKKCQYSLFSSYYTT